MNDAMSLNVLNALNGEFVSWLVRHLDAGFKDIQDHIPKSGFMGIIPAISLLRVQYYNETRKELYLRDAKDTIDGILDAVAKTSGKNMTRTYATREALKYIG